MKMNYLTRVQQLLHGEKVIYTRKKTSRILDGYYESIYKGRSLNFDDLKEYVPGDEIKDIDWKASAKGRKILVREFVADRKHNIMLIIDSNKKMLAHTDSGDEKAELAWLSAGMVAYMARENGDYVGGAYTKGNSIAYYPFETNYFNIEKILACYDSDVRNNSGTTISRIFDFVANYVKKRMIVFVVTDIEGIASLTDSDINRITAFNDLLFINIDDTDLSGKDVYSVEADCYLPEFFSQNKKIKKMTEDADAKRYRECMEKCKKHGVSVVTVRSRDDVEKEVFGLFERHKYANIR